MANHLEPTEHWLQHLDLRDTHIPRIMRSWSTRDKIIAEMGKRGNALALEIKRKLELLQELSESDRMYIKRKVRGPYTPYVLSEKKRGFLSSSKIAKLNKSRDTVPPMQYRTFTLDGIGYTNGFTSLTDEITFLPSDAFVPDWNHRKGEGDPTQMRASIFDILLEELRPMLGYHLLWRNRIQDELLSWTSSYLFATVHLYLRHLKGQKVGYVAMINRTRAFHPTRWYLRQPEPRGPGPVSFYPATRLCYYAKMNAHPWVCSKDEPGLHPRKLNHESITHGVVCYPGDDELRPSGWADIVDAGLFELVPELKVCFCSMAAGLYTVLRHIRISNYNRISRTTERELEIAQKIAWLHTRSPSAKDREESRPNLWAFLHALTFRKRAPGDKLLQKQIRKMGYTRRDLDENLHRGLSKLPANLPELHSLYHLAVDVQSVVGGKPLRPLVLTGVHSRRQLFKSFRGRTDKDYDRTCRPKLIRPNTIGYEIKGECGLPCDCGIWGPTKKRRLNLNQSNDDPEDNGQDQDQDVWQDEDEDDGTNRDDDEDIAGFGTLGNGSKRQKTAESSFTVNSVIESESDTRKDESMKDADEGEESSRLTASRTL